MSNQVLFLVDLSSDFPALTPVARKMFDRPNVEIVMLHAIDDTSHSMRGLEVARHMAQLEFLAKKEFSFARTSARVLRGHPADCILAYPETATILLPVNTPDSVRREIIAKSPCDVWVDWRQEWTPAPEEVRQVCCAITLESVRAQVLCHAVELAEHFDAPLTILHAVVPESPMMMWWDADAVTHEVRVARSIVEDLRDRFAPKAQIHVEHGRIDWVVNQALHRLDAGLLIAPGHDETIMAAAATCPVLRVSRRQPQVARAASVLAAIA